MIAPPCKKTYRVFVTETIYWSHYVEAVSENDAIAQTDSLMDECAEKFVRDEYRYEIEWASGTDEGIPALIGGVQ